MARFVVRRDSITGPIPCLAEIRARNPRERKRDDPNRNRSERRHRKRSRKKESRNRDKRELKGA